MDGVTFTDGPAAPAGLAGPTANVANDDAVSANAPSAPTSRCASCHREHVAARVVVNLYLSVTVTVNVKLPGPAGLPLSTPLPLSFTFVGSAPEVTLNLYGSMPPLAVRLPVVQHSGLAGRAGSTGRR